MFFFFFWIDVFMYGNKKKIVDYAWPDPYLDIKNRFYIKVADWVFNANFFVQSGKIDCIYSFTKFFQYYLWNWTQ